MWWCVGIPRQHNTIERRSVGPQGGASRCMLMTRPGSKGGWETNRRNVRKASCRVLLLIGIQSKATLTRRKIATRTADLVMGRITCTPGEMWPVSTTLYSGGMWNLCLCDIRTTRLRVHALVSLDVHAGTRTGRHPDIVGLQQARGGCPRRTQILRLPFSVCISTPFTPACDRNPRPTWPALSANIH